MRGARGARPRDPDVRQTVSASEGSGAGGSPPTAPVALTLGEVTGLRLEELGGTCADFGVVFQLVVASEVSGESKHLIFDGIIGVLQQIHLYMAVACEKFINCCLFEARISVHETAVLSVNY